MGSSHLAPALQIATTRRLTVHFNPPSSCVLEINVRGVKIVVKADDSQEHKVTGAPLWQSPFFETFHKVSPGPPNHLTALKPWSLLSSINNPG